MSNESEKTFKWSVRDPRGKIVSLTEKTYSEHIKNDHQLDDAQMREFVEGNVKESIKDPDLILSDKDNPDTRENYIKFCIIDLEDGEHTSKILKTVTEEDCVVTWMPMSKFTRHFTDDEIIYRK